MSKKKNFDLTGKGNLNTLKQDLKDKMESRTLEVIETLNDNDSVNNTSVDNAITIINNDKNLNKNEKTNLISKIIEMFTESFTFLNCPDDYETLKLEAKFLSTINKYTTLIMAHRLLKIRNERLYLIDNYKSFNDFIENELEVSRRSAYNYIQLVENFGDMLMENKKWEYSKLLPIIPVIKLIPDIEEKESVKRQLFNETLIKSKREIENETDKLKNKYGATKKKNIYNEVIHYIEKRLLDATENEKYNLMEIIKKLNSF